MTKFKVEEPKEEKRYIAVPTYSNGRDFRGITMKPVRKCKSDAEADALAYVKGYPDVPYAYVCEIKSKAVAVIEQETKVVNKTVVKLLDF